MPAENPLIRPSDPNQLLFRGQAPDGTWGLYLVRTDGGSPTHLGLDPGFERDRNYGINADHYFLAPAWSPDGRRLAYHTLAESTVDIDPGFRVHVADVDAAGAVIAETMLAPEPGIDDEFDAAWLPDGSGVVVNRVEEDEYDIVRWPISEPLDATTTPVVLDGGQFPDRFVIAPDGTGVLAWRPGSPASIVPMDGGPAATTKTVHGEDATWQRTAP